MTTDPIEQLKRLVEAANAVRNLPHGDPSWPRSMAEFTAAESALDLPSILAAWEVDRADIERLDKCHMDDLRTIIDLQQTLGEAQSRIATLEHEAGRRGGQLRLLIEEASEKDARIATLQQQLTDAEIAHQQAEERLTDRIAEWDADRAKLERWSQPISDSAFGVIESIAGVTDESTPAGEAWAEVCGTVNWMGEKIAELKAWKDSAMTVLAEWDDVFKAAGSPGQLGASKAESTKARIAKLEAVVELQDKLLACYRIGKNPGNILDKLRKAKTALEGGQQ